MFAQKCNLYDGDISLEKARFLDPKTISKWSDEYKLIDGDILVNSTGTGTVGRTRLFHSDVLGDYPFVVPDSHVSVIRSFEEIESKFVLAFLSSDYGQTYIEDNLAGSTNQKELYIGVLDNMQFPLPPHEEQLRIVTTVDKWFTLIDTLESAKEDLQTSIAQAKSKILDLAIHGKLVPQDPNDEPAIELLKRINPKFTPCDNAHYPFEIPTTWCLTYVKVIVDNPSCKPFQILQSDINDIGQTPVVSQSSNYIEGYSDRNDCVFQNKNAVLIFGDHTRNLKYVDFNFIVGADGVKIIIPHILVKYSYYALQFIINGMRNRGYARHYSVLANSTIPIPPLAEQHRIVAKIEELFAVLDEIQKSIEA